MQHQAFQLPQSILTALDSFLGSTQGQILYRDSDKWKALAPSTAAYGLTSGGSGANPSYRPVPYRFATTEITGSASTTMTVSGISGANHFPGVMFWANLKNATASNSNISVYVNGDTTAGNYDNTRASAIGSTVACANSNAALVTVLTASSYAYIIGWATKIADNKIRIWMLAGNAVTSALEMRWAVVMYRTTGDISGITISGSVASSLDVGSNMTVASMFGSG